MREDLCKLRPLLGRFAGVLWPAPDDGASDRITIHNWGLLELQHSKHSVLRLPVSPTGEISYCNRGKQPECSLGRHRNCYLGKHLECSLRRHQIALEIRRKARVRAPGLCWTGRCLCTLTIAQSRAGSRLQPCVGQGAVVHPDHSAKPSRVRAPGLCWTGRRCAPQP